MTDIKRDDQNNISLEQWDDLMLSILDEMFAMSKTCASENVKNVLEISKNFLNQETHQALDNFHNLYFKNEKAQKQSDEFNSIVDHVVESLQGSMRDSEQLSEKDIKKATMVLNIGETERLALSQAQKQIESLISMQDSMKEKLTPILASMQFEDMMRQRVEHLEIGYQKICQLSESCSPDDIKSIVDELEALCASKEETAEFFEEVKKEDPPQNFTPKSSVFTF